MVLYMGVNFMRIITKAKEIGFCYGVKNAIYIVQDLVKNKNVPRPIYLLGDLVHNHHINEYLTSLGIIILRGEKRIDMLDRIESGTVIFTAHGVSQEVRHKAQKMGLTIIDATCPYVKLTFNKMQKAIDNGYEILFVGKPNHPETETALSLSKNVYLVNHDITQLTFKKPLLCHQTTMSSYDIENIFHNLKSNFSNLEKMDMICKVSEKRQKSLLELKHHCFLSPALIIVIGDKSSNNSNKLYEMAKRINKSDVLFIDSISELDFQNIKKYKEIILYSGTSTPEAITNELYHLLLNLDNIKEKRISSKLILKDYPK